MDFLDPTKKRQRTIRLNIGHFLMAMIVVMGTFILVFRAYGFDVDRNSGEVIQNALVYVDSAPDRATIKVNGSDYKDQTNTRLALQEGGYRLEINKSGYRGWQRNFNVLGGSVERFIYPVLFPEKLVSTEIQALDGVPPLATESPDRRWVVVNQPGAIDTFVQYDLNSLVDRKPSTSSFKLPVGLLSAPEGPQSWQFVEWASDNKHILLKHMFTGGHEYIMVNRADPAQSLNITRSLGQNPVSAVLLDKRSDRLYVTSEINKSLGIANLETKTVTPLLSGIQSFKPHGEDMILYASAVPNDPSKARISLRTGSETFILRDVPASANLPLDIARFDSHWYFVIGSDSEQKTYIYKDPQDVLRERNGRKPAAAAVLRAKGPIHALAFSQNTRMLMVNSGQHFSVYDAETQRSYRYDLANPIDPGSLPVWMDGHRVLIRSAGKVVAFDYDGINKQTLVAAEPSLPMFFDRDYTALYNIGPSSNTAGKQAFIRTELRVLPK